MIFFYKKLISNIINQPLNILKLLSFGKKKRKVEAEKFYTNRIEELKVILKKVQKKHSFFTLMRLFFFLISASSFFIFWGSLLVIPSFIVFFGLFLYMVNLSVDTKYNRDKLLALIKINENELQVLAGDWSMYDEGNEYKNGQHPFTLDMDIFGKKSVFQLLNRSVSKQGKEKLAETLASGTDKIEVNSACIDELSKNITWCQDFISEGVVNKKDTEKDSELHLLSKHEIRLSKLINFLRYFLPFVAIVSTVLFSIGSMSAVVFGVIFLLVMTVIGNNIKTTNSISQSLTIQTGRVNTILKQLELYSLLKTESPILKKEQDELLNSETGVIHSMIELNKIMKRFDYRGNLLVGSLLNFFSAWDFQILFQLKKWLEKNGEQLYIWEDKLAEIEVWISGAVFRFNNPKSTFSEINNENDDIEIVGLSHPFVDQSKCVLNDFNLSSTENFIIITGPNMAGKSTYLRSIGLTFVFANAGFPVLAKSCKLPLLKLFSSMRTSDDLTVESSYFHAELIRLRFIMDAIERGEKVFIILDEILKGTNSKDKEIGSAKFLQKLKRLNSKGIIATHDLSLCELSVEDTSFRNMYFDSTIEGENLSFDYKINEGICKNMNASFLLKQMRLVD